MRRLLIPITALFLVLTPGTTHARDTESLKSQFFQGIANSSKQINALQRSWRVEKSSGRVNTKNASDDKWLNLSEKFRPTEYAVHGHYALMKTTAKSGKTTLNVSNDSYAFQVSKANDAAHWTIDFLEKIGNDHKTDAKILAEKHSSINMGIATWFAFRMPLDHLIQSKDFKFKGISSFANSEGTPLVRVEYDHLPSVPDQKFTRVSNGYLICNPNRDWALREFGGTTWAGELYRCQIEWDEMIDGFPHPKQLHITITSDKLPSNTEYLGLLNILNTESTVSPERFFLSHYGFPEPVFEASWMSVWMKYLLAGITCVAIAYGIKRRRAAV